MRRMDRYKDSNEVKETRTSNNKDLYQNLANNTRYTNISDVTNANAYEIDNRNKDNNTREAYQRMIKYRDIEPVPKVKKELDDFNYLYQNEKKKVYDINSFLDEARKNRQEQDELEEKRKLNNTSYNILASLNLEELEKYREEKKKRIMSPEEEEIREIIDTIATKTLAGEIDKDTTVDLLSDLMATNILDRVDNPEEIDKKNEEGKETITEVTLKINKTEETVEEKEEEKEEPEVKEVLNAKELEEISKEKPSEKKLENLDPDFYTRSMELSKNDLDMDTEFVEKKIPLPVKILLFLLVIGITAVAAYFIFQRLH